MWGAIAGDIVGSVHEFAYPPTKTTHFGPLFVPDCGFTDDTILTIATAEAILNATGSPTISDYGSAYHRWGNPYSSSYGIRFSGWLASDGTQPYNSLGNGSAMRVSPAGWAFDTLDETLRQAELTALPTHNHTEGVKGAQAVAHAIFSARHGADKQAIRDTIMQSYGYELSRTIDEIRPTYRFDETCMRTVPEAITAFLGSDDFESAIRLAISLGGDADTLACITGSIAEAYYGPPPIEMLETVRSKLPHDMLEVANCFCDGYDVR